MALDFWLYEVAIGLSKTPMKVRSWLWWLMVPGGDSMAPLKVMPERMGLAGKAEKKGRSMLRPFWMRTMAVWPGVMAGAMISVI